MTDTTSTAIVTGAASGIGKAVAEALARRGHRVHGLDLPGAGKELDSLPGITRHEIDITDADRLERLAGEIAADIVVNNAGILGAFRPLQEFSRADADRLLDVNLRAAVHLTRAALPAMLRRKRGHLLFLGSIAARIPSGGLAIYAAGKAGLLAFAEGLRWDTQGSGIRTTVLVPGRVQTHIYDGHFGGHGGAEKALYEGVEPIQPADMAQAVLFALDMPRHVDVTTLEIMPTGQVFGGSRIVPLAP